MKSLVRLHEENTKWWGSPVGIIDSDVLLKLSDSQIKDLLSPFSWVEIKCDYADADTMRLSELGFVLADTQIGFSLNLENYTEPKRRDGIQVSFACDSPFELSVGCTKDFGSERFSVLPGIDLARLNSRYVSWANRLMREHPNSSLVVTLYGEPQGWYFATSNNDHDRWNLTLAMLHKDAEIRGKELYNIAFGEYKKRGAVHCFASFSVRNFPVMNILSKAGARFDSCTACWILINSK